MSVTMLCAACRQAKPCACAPSSRRYGSRWRRFRLAFFRGAFPHLQRYPDVPAVLCVDCARAGVTKEGLELDHDTPLPDSVVSDRDPRMYVGPFAGRCSPHHAAKTTRERTGG